MANKISPHAFVSPNVIMGKGNVVEAGAIILDGVIIGDNNYIGYGCVIGDNPEKIGYFNKSRGVRIGDNNRLTKLVTIDGGCDAPTQIGNDNILLSGSHIGHDCRVYDNNTFCCGVKIGGGNLIYFYCTFGLNSSTHQRTIVPSGVMLGANGFLKGELTEWGLYYGVPAKYKGVNEVGKKRWQE